MKKINFYLILIIIFALPSYLVRFSVFGIPTTLLEVLIYISFFLTLVNYISVKLKTQSAKQQFKTKNKNMLHVTCYMLPVILFIFAGIIGIIVSPEKNVALGQFKAFIIDPILFFVVLIINFENWKLKILLKALIAGGTLVAIYAIYQKITGDVTPDGRVVGIFGYSPNYLSLYLTPIAVLTVGYGLFNYNKKPLISLYPYILISLFLILAIYFSGSRAGLAVTIISIIFLFIFNWWGSIQKSKILKILLYCYTVILLIAGWWFIKPNWQLSPEAGGRINASNNVRWEIWQTSGKMLATDNNWLWGVGLGNYQNYFTGFTKSWINYDEYISPNALTAHNLYLQTWFNLGFLGLLAFIWIIILFFQYAISNMRYAKNPQLIAYGLSLMAVMLSILLYGLIDTPYWKNDLAVMFWTIIALSIILVNRTFNEKIN